MASSCTVAYDYGHCPPRITKFLILTTSLEQRRPVLQSLLSYTRKSIVASVVWENLSVAGTLW